MARTILPTAYWGDIDYFARLVRGGGECIIDMHEHFIKRSLRNRTMIMTAGGVLPLSVCLQHADRPRTPVCDIRIDYSKRWRHQHRTAVRSAYGSSPYFDMIFERIAPFWEREWRFLADYNLEILATMLSLLGLDARFALSDEYVVAQQGDDDLRPKKRETPCVVPRYFQLFSDRQPFRSDVSVLDLLMCEGPASTLDVLNSCRW